MNLAEKLFVNYNYVKGVQNFLKEARFVKYANEDLADMDANATAQAMIDEGIDIGAEEASDENAVLEVANTLVDLAQSQPSPVKEQIEGAAAEVAKAVAPAGEVASESEMAAEAANGGGEEEEEEEEEGEEEEKEASLRRVAKEIQEGKKVAKKIAAAFAQKIKKAGDSETNPKPDQVLSISDTDYQKATSSANAPGTGQTDLKTEKGEVGAQENVESQIVEQKAQEADLHQKSEGEDIYEKDYAAPGKGNTQLKTEKGEVGDQDNVDHKLARLAMEENLAKMLGK